MCGHYMNLDIHLGLKLQQQYWTHYEFFPGHRRISEAKERELVGILTHFLIGMSCCLCFQMSTLLIFSGLYRYSYICRFYCYSRLSGTQLHSGRFEEPGRLARK